MDKSDLNKKIIAFYILVALYSCFFATGNWYFLWKLYLSNKGVGLVDGISFGIAFLLQIPSGAVADIFGRRKTIGFAAIFMGVGYAITGYALSGVMILVGYVIYSIGSSFYTGADEALMYDYLKKNGKEDLWKKIVANKYIISRLAALGATLVGGWLFTFDIRLPSIIRGLFFILMLIPIFILPENFGRLTEDKITVKEYFNKIRDGMKQLAKPALLKVIPLITVVGGILTTMYVSGILRPLLLAHAGFGGDTQSYIIGVAGIITLILLLLYKHSPKNIPDHLFMWGIGLLTVFFFSMLDILPTNSWLMFLVGIQVLQGLYIPISSNIVNHEISSTHRATALSSLALIQSLPYILLAPIIGLYADKNQYNFIIIGIVGTTLLGIFLSFFLYLRFKKPSLKSVGGNSSS